MIKKKILSIFLFGFFWLFFASIVVAEEKKASTNDLFEYSLISLKESVGEVLEKNQALREENHQIQGRIQVLKQELAGLQNENAVLSKKFNGIQGPEMRSKEMMLTEKGRRRLEFELQQLKTEEKKLGLRIAARKKNKEDLQRQISSVQLEMVEINQKIKSLEAQTAGQEFGREKIKLTQDLDEQQKDFLSAQRRLKKLESEYAKPLKLLDSLNAQHNALKQNLTAIQNELNAFLEEEKGLNRENEALNQDQSTQAASLKDETGKLQSRHQDLQEILVQAQAKLPNNLNGTNYQKQEAELKENLGVVQKENSALKRQYSSLEEKFQGLQTEN